MAGKSLVNYDLHLVATLGRYACFWETIAVQVLDERGLFSLVDLDWTNYPARFYRLAQ